MVEEQVRRTQALLAGIDPEGHVVQAPAGAVGVARVDQLARGDRRAGACAPFPPVAQLAPLVERLAERLLHELAARAYVGSQDVDVVQSLDRRAAPEVALWL